jgi:hypothetical protein
LLESKFPQFFVIIILFLFHLVSLAFYLCF